MHQSIKFSKELCVFDKNNNKKKNIILKIVIENIYMKNFKISTKQEFFAYRILKGDKIYKKSVEKNMILIICLKY